MPPKRSATSPSPPKRRKSPSPPKRRKSPSPPKRRKSPSPPKRRSPVGKQKRPPVSLKPFIKTPAKPEGLSVLKISSPIKMQTQQRQQQFPSFFYSNRGVQYENGFGSSAASGFSIPSSTGGGSVRSRRRSPRSPTF